MGSVIDGKVYIVPVGKKGFRVPVHIASYALAQNALKIDGQDSSVVESKIYVVDEENPKDEPIELTLDYIEQVKKTDGLVGIAPTIIDGKEVQKTTISFPQYKENYAKNNEA